MGLAQVETRHPAAALQFPDDRPPQKPVRSRDEHVRLIRDWMRKTPKPASGWDEDPDPPRMNE